MLTKADFDSNFGRSRERCGAAIGSIRFKRSSLQLASSIRFDAEPQVHLQIAGPEARRSEPSLSNA